MRITNSMLVSNFMNNLNNGLSKLDTLQNQLSSNRKWVHISDDPVSFIFSQQARYRLERLSNYQSNVKKAEEWLTEAEMTFLEFNKVITSAYEQCINARTNAKTPYDRQNVAQIIGQLRDHTLATLNTTFGNKYILGGYNTPGIVGEDGKVIPPFTTKTVSITEHRKDKDGNLMYHHMQGDYILDENGDVQYYEEDGDDGQGNSWSAGDPIKAFEDEPVMVTYDKNFLYFNGMLMPPYDRNPDYDPSLPATDPNSEEFFSDAKKAEMTERFEALRPDRLTLDLAPSVSMDITYNGMNAIFYDPTNPQENIFNLMDDFYNLLMDENTEVEELAPYITKFQTAQNHVLGMTAEIGGKMNRIEMINSRYDTDYVNYMQMKSDAEDADQAELIMNYKMAEAVYKAALSVGSFIIQPTLMDFMR